MSEIIEISEFTDADRADWERFALCNSQFHAHSINWKQIIQNSFSHLPLYFLAKNSRKEIVGIAPMFLVNSLLFGKALISVPYLNGGGILASNHGAYEALYNHLLKESEKHKVKYFELRHRHLSIFGVATPVVRSHKVAMLLKLSGTTQDLFQRFPAKLRSQIRRPAKSGATVTLTSGSMINKQQLNDFYSVFAQNMKDLGTPVYPRSLFANTLQSFGNSAHLAIVYFENQAVAAGITIDWGTHCEIPWASSLRKFNHISANMALYWSLIEAAQQRGLDYFDFGRSSPNSGPFKFKEQWGAEPLPLNWIYHSDTGNIPDVNPNNDTFSLLVKTWQKLPLAITKFFGPYLTRSLP